MQNSNLSRLSVVNFVFEGTEKFYLFSANPNGTGFGIKWKGGYFIKVFWGLY